MHIYPSFLQPTPSSFLFPASRGKKRTHDQTGDASDDHDTHLEKKSKDEKKGEAVEPEQELVKKEQPEKPMESACGLVHDHLATILVPNVERLKEYLTRCPAAIHYDADSIQTISIALIKIQRFGEIAFFIQKNLKLLEQVEKERAQKLIEKYCTLLKDLKVTVIKKLREEIEHVQGLEANPANVSLTQNRIKIIKQLHEIGRLFEKEVQFLEMAAKNKKAIEVGALAAPVDIANAINDLKKRVLAFSEVLESQGINEKSDALLQEIGSLSKGIQKQLHLLGQKQPKFSVALSYLHYTAISNLRDFFATFIKRNLNAQKDTKGFLDFASKRLTYIHNIFTEQQS
jgi:hypothetical protein